MKKKDEEVKRIPICPVTFVKDLPIPTTNLNRIFIDPYTNYACNSLFRASMFDYIKDKGEIYKEDQDGYSICKRDALKYDSADRYASLDAIKAFSIMNITNLVNEILYKFSVEAFGMNKPDFDSATYQIGINGINIPENIEMIIDRVIYNTTKYEEQGNIGINIIIDTLLDSIFSYVTYRIFDRFILNIVNTDGVLPDLYAYFFAKSFGHDLKDDPVASGVTIDTMYTFVTSILRETMQKYLGEFRTGLTLMTSTIKNMILYKPDYFNRDKLNDKDYRVGDLYRSNPMLVEHINPDMMKSLVELASITGGNIIDELQVRGITASEGGETE